jgi:hypothetical protein
MSIDATIFWWPLIAVVLHITEEFYFPGGFAEWDRSYRPAFQTSITPRFHVLMNGGLLFACLTLVLNESSEYLVAAWLLIAALLASNALWHIVGVARTRAYSPGVATGLALYIPMMLVGYAHFLRTDRASVPTAVAAFAIGGSYHWWARILHLFRARK